MGYELQIVKKNQYNIIIYKVKIVSNKGGVYVYIQNRILTVGTKWLSDKADANDVAMLDNLINERAADGWELVTYDYMATSMQIKGAFVVTFRKEKDDKAWNGLE